MTAAARTEDAAPALCMTKTLLARPPDELLSVIDRLHLLVDIADSEDLGLVVANRGTYLDVAHALRTSGCDASFVIGSDKLAQLDDPSFYTDGERGVARTFDELRFIVVPRPHRSHDRPQLRWLEPSDVFADPAVMTLSATDVRRRLREGIAVDDLVPPGVALALGGYTSSK